MELSDYEFQRVITAWLQLGTVFLAAIALTFSMMKARIEKRNTHARTALPVTAIMTPLSVCYMVSDNRT